MKTLSTTALILPLALCAMPAAARQLSPAEALARVNGTETPSHMRIKADPQPVMTVTPKANPGFNSLYVFDNGDNGFILVSADDDAMPLLGYSDSGKFIASEINPNLRYWLDFYASEIEAASRSKSAMRVKRSVTESEREPIAPMTVSKWNQSAPYNDDCPMDNGKRSVTGCVATAMAQAMYFHQYPAKGSGSHSYEWNDTTLSVDFGTTTYDWNAMTPTYDSSSSAEAKAAVATLMYSCGVSVDMDYTSDESGASSLSMGTALYKYFGYDKSMASPQRYFYGAQDWEDMVYDQLAQGLPVLYGGQSYEGGHQFICDGYSQDGYFHFNWGWGGMSDGYFLLSALDPLDQGIGGSASNSGFNYDQGILINMKPAQADSKVTPLIYCYGDFETTATGAVNLGNEIVLKSSDGFFNFAVDDIEGYLGIKAVDSDGNARYIFRDGSLGLASISGYKSYDVKLPADLADGTYTVTPVFKQKDTDDVTDILCPLSGVQALTMTVNQGTATFSAATLAKAQVTSLDFNTPVYLDKNFEATITFTNPGTEEYYGEFLMYLFNENGEEAGQATDIDSIDLLPGETKTVTYVSAFPSEYSTENGTVTLQPGSYMMAIYSHFTNEQLYVYPQMVNVQQAPASTQLDVLSFSIDGGNNVVDTRDVKFNGTVECTQGYFAGQLTVAVFKDGSESTSMSGKSGYLFLSEGDSDSFTADVDISSATGDSDGFFAIVFNGDSEISNAYHFTVSTSGVITIDEAPGINISLHEGDIDVTSEIPLANLSIYTIDGIRIMNVAAEGNTQLSVGTAELPAAQYIIVASDTAGNHKTVNVRL